MFGVWGLLRQLALEGLGSLLWCDERDREGRAAADYIICMRAYSRHGARGIYIYNVLDMLCHYIIPVLDSQSNQDSHYTINWY